ncbi:MAG: DUF1232 domain-containing protein [Peptococcaceae bacterium]|nr:DUF1232 domain-containing protein [Peptococcaceae bacterium]
MTDHHSNTDIGEKNQEYYQRLKRRVIDYARSKAGKVGEKVAEYLLLLPDMFLLLVRLSLDPRVASTEKKILALAVLYIISPLDFLPEAAFGPLGLSDDVVLALYVLNRMINNVPREVVLEHWSGDRDLFETVRSGLAVADRFVSRRVLERINRLLGRR